MSYSGNGNSISNGVSPDPSLNTEEYLKSVHTRMGGGLSVAKVTSADANDKSRGWTEETDQSDKGQRKSSTSLGNYRKEQKTGFKRKRSTKEEMDKMEELPKKRRRKAIDRLNVCGTLSNSSPLMPLNSKEKMKKRRKSDITKESNRNLSRKLSVQKSLEKRSGPSLRKSKDSNARRHSIGVLRSSPKVNSHSPSLSRSNFSLLKQKTRIDSTDTSPPSLRERRKSSISSQMISPSFVDSSVFSGTSKTRNGSANSKNKTTHQKLSPFLNERDVSASKKTVNYRMSVSPKMNNLPTVLSLNSLSGIPNQKVSGGSSFSSLRQTFGGANISGTPPLLPKSNSSPFTTSAPRPLCLVLKETEKMPPPLFQQNASMDKTKMALKDDDTSNLFTECIQERADNSRKRTGSKRMSLADTVEMLKKQKTQPSEDSTFIPQCSLPTNGILEDKPLTPSPSPVSSCSSEAVVSQFTPLSSPKKASGSVKTSPEMCWKNSSSRKSKQYRVGPNQEVLARWHDGLFYLGKILKLDEKNEKCLLRYEDNSEFWSLFKHIHRGAKNDEMLCCICLGETSDCPNEIVICDHCGLGYHQKCHSPSIDSGECLDPDDEWTCRECVFAFTAKRGGALTDGPMAQLLQKMKYTLTYDINLLTWDAQHRSNIEQSYCYCGGPGVWHQKMLQCCRCKQWFHEACLQCLDYPLLCADSFYLFTCGMCNNHTEYLRRLDIDWADLTHIILYNLSIERNRKFFHFNDDIIPWLKENWRALQLKTWDGISEEERTKRVEETLVKTKSRFANCVDARRSKDVWSLRAKVPPPPRNITLPFEGEVNDEIMDKLKVKGRRSKVFIPCQSPVLKRSPAYNGVSPSVLSPGSKAKWTIIQQTGASAAPDGQGQETAPAPAVRPCPSRKANVKPTLLDKLIPWPVSFAEESNPFWYDVEVKNKQDENESRARIWRASQMFVDDNTSHSSIETGSTASSEGPPTLSKEEGPVVPSLNLSPPQLEEAGKKKGTPKSRLNPPSQETNSAKRRKTRGNTVTKVTNTPEAAAAQSSVKPDIQFIKSKQDGEEMCMAVYEKAVYSRSLQILGRRLNSHGELQYLVDWNPSMDE